MQLISAIAPQLSRKNPNAIHYICTIFNFVFMADYTFYTNKTLQYMEYILMHIDKTKEVF